MIVELLGPPAVGKTTLADALAIALRKYGCEVQLVASSRPAEREPNKGEGTAAAAQTHFPFVAPLSRAAKLASAVPALLSRGRDDATGTCLMKLLPPRGLLWRVRLRRYLSMLHQSWDMAGASEGVAIFDQGYLSALSSLALLTSPSSVKNIARGLAIVPKPNLVVCLDAPSEVLRSRLCERLRRQGVVERMFELDLETNLRQGEIVSSVAGLVREQGLPVMEAGCLDIDLLDSEVNKMALKILAQRELLRNGG